MENPQRWMALGAFWHPRDVVGIAFLRILSWSFIAPRRITSSQNYHKTDRYSLAQGPNFSLIWKQFGHSFSVTTLAMDASTTMLSWSRPSNAVASWSRRISSAERAIRDRSVRFLFVEREREKEKCDIRRFKEKRRFETLLRYFIRTMTYALKGGNL